jgi:hypothetical protein
VLCPNSKTRRSKPGWCATRIATNWAWLLSFPPVARGHAAAGEGPVVGAADGMLVAEGLDLVVAVGLAAAEDAAVGVADRDADAVAVDVAGGCAPC